jgi:hypothetical protein
MTRFAKDCKRYYRLIYTNITTNLANISSSLTTVQGLLKVIELAREAYSRLSQPIPSLSLSNPCGSVPITLNGVNGTSAQSRIGGAGDMQISG